MCIRNISRKISMADEDLAAMFEMDNQYFKKILDMVPARILFDDDLKRKIRGEEEIDDDRDSLGMKKKKKFGKGNRGNDPLQRRTVTQLQEDLQQREGNNFTKLHKKGKKKKKGGGGQQFTSITQNLEALRGRLQARITELTGKKTKLTEEEFKEKTRLMKEKKKLKLKLNRAQKQNRHKGQQGQTPNTDKSSEGSDSTMPSDKPVFKKDGKLVFSKFDFTDFGDDDKQKTDLKGKNYKRLLEKLEKRKKTINETKEKNEDAGSKLEEKSRWKMALLKAEGEKVKDNELLLKKAVKRKEKEKKKKKKSWDSRTKQVEQERKKKVDKRKTNLDSRKKQKLDKKKKKLAKKGHLIPGF